MPELSAVTRGEARAAIAGLVGDVALWRAQPSDETLDAIVDAVAVHTTVLPPRPDRYELSADEREAAVAAIRYLGHDAAWTSGEALDEILDAINEARGFENV
ncbi:hypothetical protein SEA_FEFFERHEAD_70 [Mycobacterium phage Fefferhead]|nr:hypothetical protein SEA_FEFFERHEAD_70 [Mycobacterium phage Fefferhead]